MPESPLANPNKPPYCRWCNGNILLTRKSGLAHTESGLVRTEMRTATSEAPDTHMVRGLVLGGVA